MMGKMGQELKLSDRETVIITCVDCHVPVDTGVSKAEYEEWQQGHANIHDAMPLVPKELREMFLSGICGRCFDNLFRGDGDEHSLWEDDERDYGDDEE